MTSFAVVILFAAGCKPTRTSKLPTKPEVVATVAGAEISVDALRKQLDLRSASGVQAALTLEQKLAVLESLVREEAVFAKAKATGFDDTPEMQAELRSFIVSRYREKNPVARPVVANASEVEAHYRQNAAKYAIAPAVRGAMVYLPVPAAATPAKRAEAKARAESVLAEARKGADAAAFAQVVVRHSADQATRYHGGELPWLEMGSREMDAALVEALFELKNPGDLAPLIEVPNGFYIAKLLERRDAGTRPLADVEDGIRYELAKRASEKAEEDYFKAIKAGLDIQILTAAVDAIIPSPDKEPAPPRMPESVSGR